MMNTQWLFEKSGNINYYYRRNFNNMKYEFEIIGVKWQHNRGDFIFARHLGNSHDFEISDGSVFGDIPVYHYKEMYPLRDSNGEPKRDIFVFRPTSMTWLKKNHFVVGQHVNLTIE